MLFQGPISEASVVLFKELAWIAQEPPRMYDNHHTESEETVQWSDKDGFIALILMPFTRKLYCGKAYLMANIII